MLCIYIAAFLFSLVSNSRRSVRYVWHSLLWTTCISVPPMIHLNTCAHLKIHLGSGHIRLLQLVLLFFPHVFLLPLTFWFRIFMKRATNIPDCFLYICQSHRKKIPSVRPEGEIDATRRILAISHLQTRPWWYPFYYIPKPLRDR